MAEILRIVENEDGRGALMEISLEAEEMRVLLELAVNGILREAIDKQAATATSDA